jgi:hypothetical protein
VRGEAGFYARAREILRDGTLCGYEDDYLRKEFPDSRDRTTALAGTVGTAGSFLLALVAIVIAIASGVSEQSNKVVSAGNAATSVAAGCLAETQTPACTEQRVSEARQTLATAQARLEEIASLNQKNAIVGGFVVAAFLVGLLAQFSTPIPPISSDVSAWNGVLVRYRIKRWMIISSLLFQLAAVAVLLYMAGEVVG